VERLVTPDRRIAWYLPAGIEEDPPPLLVYPYLGLGSDGEAWLCLKLSRGSWFRWLHPEEARFSFGGRDLTIGFDSSEVWFRFAPEGAREEVTFTNRVDLIRAIADAPDVVVVLAGPDGREERHGFDPGDRERFRSILSLFDDLRGSGARFHPGGWTIEESIPWPLPASLPKLVPESRVNPRWPDSGRSWRRQGTVVLSAYVLPDGTVGGLRSLKEAGRNHEFAEAAIEAVRRWRYEPATANGRPVPASLSVTVEFRHQEQ
jgi:TonB family protein